MNDLFSAIILTISLLMMIFGFGFALVYLYKWFEEKLEERFGE